MQTDALPTAAIWDGYAVAGIVFVVILVLLFVGWKVFREYRSWQTAESDLQRKWYERMEDKREKVATARDEQMRTFMAGQQEKQIQADQETSRVLNSLVSRIDGLTAVMSAQSKALSDHDAKIDQRITEIKAQPKRRANAER